MTCKDCVHCRACHEMYLVAVAQEDDFFERHDADTCEDFKHKYSFVEVVKCEDCKHDVRNGGDCDRVLIHTRRNLVLEQNEYLYYKLNYCEYGEPKPQ